MQKTPLGRWDTRLSLEPGKKAETSIEAPDSVTIEEDEHGYSLLIKGTVEEPIIIRHGADEEAHCNLAIILEEDAHATIIEHSAKEFTHDVDIALGDRATLGYAFLQRGKYRGTKKAALGRDASLTCFELDQGHSVSRIETALGEGAHATSASIYLGGRGDRIDFGATARHEGAHSSSDLYTRGVLAHALSIYDGVLSIGKDAAKSNAHQRADALILTKDAEAKSSPRLFIENNDVTCSHAATTTHADDAMLFYLQSRGLPRAEAERLLVKAFLWPAVQKMPERLGTAVAPAVEDRITQYMEALYE